MWLLSMPVPAGPTFIYRSLTTYLYQHACMSLPGIIKGTSQALPGVGPARKANVSDLTLAHIHPCTQGIWGQVCFM